MQTSAALDEKKRVIRSESAAKENIVQAWRTGQTPRDDDEANTSSQHSRRVSVRRDKCDIVLELWSTWLCSTLRLHVPTPSTIPVQLLLFLTWKAAEHMSEDFAMTSKPFFFALKRTLSRTVTMHSDVDTFSRIFSAQSTSWTCQAVFSQSRATAWDVRGHK